MTFDVDHFKLLPGIYVSDIQKVGNVRIVTLDFRVCRPNVSYMFGNTAHTVEHVLAYFFTKAIDKYKGMHKVYWGPMGCMTGFYLVIALEPSLSSFRDWKVKLINAIIEAVTNALKTKYIPGCSPQECGRFYDLKWTGEVEEVLKTIWRYACELLS